MSNINELTPPWVCCECGCENNPGTNTCWKCESTYGHSMNAYAQRRAARADPRTMERAAEAYECDVDVTHWQLLKAFAGGARDFLAIVGITALAFAIAYTIGR